MTSADVHISGLVLDQRMAAMEGAEVRVLSGGTRHRAVTNINGFFDLPPMPSGEIHLEVRSAGGEPSNAVLTLLPGDVFLRLTPGGEETARPAPGIIEGVVRDRFKAIAGAGINLIESDQGIRLMSFSNDYGRFELSPVPAGSYQLVVSRDEETLAEGQLDVSWMAAEYLSIRIGEGIRRESGFFGGCLSGTGGDGENGFTVEAINVLSGESVRLAVEPSGRFHHDRGLSRGMYHIALVRNGATLLEERMFLQPAAWLDISLLHGIRPGTAED